jgi:hypothetical protein
MNLVLSLLNFVIPNRAESPVRNLLFAGGALSRTVEERRFSAGSAQK